MDTSPDASSEDRDKPDSDVSVTRSNKMSSALSGLAGAALTAGVSLVIFFVGQQEKDEPDAVPATDVVFVHDFPDTVAAGERVY